MTKPSLAIHGGAGTILRSTMTTELEAEYRFGLKNALNAGWEILSAGGESLDAVEASVRELENFPLFNAGCGAVFTSDGINEMDAALMDGKSLKAGAVAAVRNIKNPIALARLVMERTEHILLTGEGAMQFARDQAIAIADDKYFYTEERWRQLQDAIASGKVMLDHAKAKPIGTVGAVACDKSGHLSAATSTGGMTNKKFGRIGDTPLIGLGTYADDVCAVSCTGHGEYFMLGVTAYDVSARMKYKNIGLAEAASETIERLTAIDGEGGLIAVDSLGNLTLPFNSDGMYRASVSEGSEPLIEIYR